MIIISYVLTQFTVSQEKNISEMKSREDKEDTLHIWLSILFLPWGNHFGTPGGKEKSWWTHCAIFSAGHQRANICGSSMEAKSNTNIFKSVYQLLFMIIPDL